MLSREYHIQLGSEDVGKYALLPDAPNMVETIANFLEKSVFLVSNREFTSYAGYLDNERITVISSGIGGPSTAIAVEELHRLGVHTIIRIGTCSTLQPYIRNGSMIIPYGVVRGGKTADEYLPSRYPAIPHPDVFYALRQSAQKTNTSVYTGITHCKDAFYKEEAEKMPDSEGVKNYWKIYRKANVLSSEMETDTLLVVSSLRGIRAGAIFSAIGAIEGASIAEITGIKSAIKISIDALQVMIKKDRIDAKREREENISSQDPLIF